MKLKEYKYKINGIKFTVGVGDIVNNQVQVEVNGTPYTVEIDESQAPKAAAISQSVKRPAAAPRTETGEKVINKPAAPSGSASAVKSPLPGTIMSFNVAVGDTVNAGDTVCVLEAMKMEIPVVAPEDGQVLSINAAEGDSIETGDTVACLKPQSAGE